MLKITKRRRKSKRLGLPAQCSAADYLNQSIDTKVEPIRALIPLGLMAVQKMLETKV